ncbi:MAG: Gfo/Idh/MocA family protein [Candidatus Sumerlaeia bacterium]
MSEIRWGIIAPGGIARKFADGLKAVPGAKKAAVASRSLKRAQDFADEYGFERAYGSYEELAADPDVDAVYVASPHSHHMEHSLLCIEAGKAVLCEKPFTVNAGEAQKVFDAAKEKGVFIMEAMWTRFLPMICKVREWLADGMIGEPRMVMADFGFAADFDPEKRHFNPALAGGGLLDVGVYPISFAAMVFGGGMPDRIGGLADLGETGVDEQAVMTLGFGPEKLALLACGVRTSTPQAARVIGSKGSIEIPPAFWRGTRAILKRNGHDPEEIDMPHQSNGYEYEAMEVQKCLETGKLESDIMPHSETLKVMRIMDTLREQWGIVYPMEK